nr:hypothetical protein [Tanacetum cinerariifolium]
MWIHDTLQLNHASQKKLLLMNASKPKIVKGAKKNRDTSMHGVSRTPALVKPPQKKCAFQMSAPEDDSFEIDDALAANIAEPKESEKPVSSSEIDVGFGGSVSEQGLGFKLPASPPLTTNTQNNLLMDNVVPEKDSNSFLLFGTSAERVSLFAFSTNGPSDSKPSASSDPKALEST